MGVLYPTLSMMSVGVSTVVFSFCEMRWLDLALEGLLFISFLALCCRCIRIILEIAFALH